MLMEAVDLVKVYPMGVRALDGASLAIGRGELVGIMGRSGSGKSTLMQILGCLDRPTAGRVLLEGFDLSRLSDRLLPALRLRKLGFVFQAHNLIPALTALENVALPLRYLRLGPAERLARARSMLAMVGLEDRLHHLPSQLSGGQQQRVAIARALVNNPALILADEPTGALDTQTARQLLTLMRHLVAEQGRTFVVVTHDPVVGQACDRIYEMEDGRIHAK